MMRTFVLGSVLLCARVSGEKAATLSTTTYSDAGCTTPSGSAGVDLSMAAVLAVDSCEAAGTGYQKWSCTSVAQFSMGYYSDAACSTMTTGIGDNPSMQSTTCVKPTGAAVWRKVAGCGIACDYSTNGCCDGTDKTMAKEDSFGTNCVGGTWYANTDATKKALAAGMAAAGGMAIGLLVAVIVIPIVGIICLIVCIVCLCKQCNKSKA